MLHSKENTDLLDAFDKIFSLLKTRSISLILRRVSSEENPADLPSRDRFMRLQPFDSCFHLEKKAPPRGEIINQHVKLNSRGRLAKENLGAVMLHLAKKANFLLGIQDTEIMKTLYENKEDLYHCYPN